MQENNIEAELSDFESSGSSESEYFSINQLETQENDPCASPTILDGLNEACMGGRLNLVQTFPLGYVDVECIMHAMRFGHIDIVEYFMNSKLVARALFKEACSWAAELDSFAILKWLVLSGCTPTVNTFIHATIHGDMTMLEYLHTLSTDTIRSNPLIVITAAEHGSYAVMFWLIQNGYKTVRRIGLVAAHPKHVESPEYDRLMVLIQLYESGLYTPEHDSEIIKQQDWAGAINDAWPPLVSLVHNACNKYDVGILRWAVYVGFEFDLNKLHSMFKPARDMRTNHRYLAMDAYISNVLEHELSALGRPQKYDRKKVENRRVHSDTDSVS